MLWIQNAMIPELNRVDDVLVKDDNIFKIGRESVLSYVKGTKEKVDMIEAEGLYLLPSFVDSHFHLRNPGFAYKQTYGEADVACMKGGYTDVVAMANTKPVADCPEVVQEVLVNAKPLHLDVYQAGSVTKGLLGEELVAFKEMMALTKIFSDDGKNVDNAEVMKKALAKSQELGFLIMDHSEPETEMVIRNIELVKEVGGNLHFCHISRKASVEAIVKAKEMGLHVTFEVTPHHLFSYGLSYRVNPPIATKEDSEYLVESIKRGYVDYVGTDHAPHSDDDKKKGAPGIINIENAFSMIRKVCFEHNVDWNTMIQLMSVRPATLIDKKRGVQEGNIADLILVSDKETILSKEELTTRSKNTPYDGKEVRGIVEKTIVKGEIAYDNERA